jgi:uncharacterized protein (DUF1800 family)
MARDPKAEAALALHRFGFGPRLGSIAAIASDPRGALIAELDRPGAGRISDPDLLTSGEAARGAFNFRQERKARRLAERAQREAAKTAPPPTPERQAAMAAPPAEPRMEAQAGEVAPPKPNALPGFPQQVYLEEAKARIDAALGADLGFAERLVWFWSNHFCVSADKGPVRALCGAYEREAIRAHVLGRFADMLVAVESHPAMLIYLDNARSIGPDSIAGRNQHRGLNENLAREILELHTLGVGGGYTQTDVTTFAEVITGWSIGGEGGGRFARGEPNQPGQFVFRPELHEPGTKVVLGKRYADDGFGQGMAVLRDVARQRATARFIATKLTRHFIADDPPPTAVQRLAEAFSRSGGDLPTVYRALIDANEAWQQPLAKYKTPCEYVVSSYRGLTLPVETGHAPLAPFEILGQRTWSPGSPAGWPDRSADWDGASALFKRIQWADAVGARLGNRRDATELAPQLLGANLTDGTRAALAHAASASQAITLLLAAPEFMRR